MQPGKQSIVYPEPPMRVKGRRVLGALSLFGPGAIIASVTIASGETIFASRTGAVFGYTLLWFIVVCAASKMVQVYTGARYMTLCGEHPMEAWSRLPGPRGWFPALLGAISVLCFPFWIGGLAMFTGTALNWTFGFSTDPESGQWFYVQCFATGAIFLAIVLTLIQSYRILEKVQTIIVGILLMAILAAVAVAPVDWLEALRGTLSVHLPAYPDWVRANYADVVNKEKEIAFLVTFMAAVGGGTYDYIGYLGFYRAKKWGALGADNAWDVYGAVPVLDQSRENIKAGRQWLRAPMIDVFTSFACVLIFTMAFNVLGAAVLHPQRLVPNQFDLLSHQAQFLTQINPALKYLYQLGIFMALWGTIYAAFEVYSRTTYECFRPLLRQFRSVSYARVRLPVCLYAGIGGLVLAWVVSDPISIVSIITPIATLTCGIWCFAMIWADRHTLPRPFQMNWVWVLLSIVAGVIMTGFGGMAMWDTMAKFFA